MILNYDHEPFIIQANDPNVSISPPSAKKLMVISRLIQGTLYQKGIRLQL
jgi:hypothetical protein